MLTLVTPGLLTQDFALGPLTLTLNHAYPEAPGLHAPKENPEACLPWASLGLHAPRDTAWEP